PAPFPSDIPGGRGGSSRALHFAATGIQGSTGLGTLLRTGASCDASAYQGIEFWARLVPPPHMPPMYELTVGLHTDDTCAPTCASPYVVHLSVGTAWDYYRIKFSAFSAAGRPALDPSRLRSLQILLSGSDFEAWVDDVAFIAM